MRALRAFLAAEAARDQGEDVFRGFHLELLRAIHERKMPVQDGETIKEAASQVPGLDFDRLESDLERPELRERIAGDYRRAVDREGIFGTPTLLFPGGDAVFVKTAIPPAEDAMGMFEAVESMGRNRAYLRELKKPRRPEPAS